MNRRCIVTGGSAGLGRVVGRRLAELGDRVIVVGRDAVKLEQTKKGLESIQIAVADITDPAQCERVVQEAIQQWGGVDVLVNVVGASDRGRIDELDARSVHDLIDTNVITTLHMTLAAGDALKQTGGVVINIGSIAGRVGARYLGGYAIAKHALAGMTQQLRLEWKDRGVHVGLISPGPIARPDAGNRYNDAVADRNIPASAARPGGGTRVRGLDPNRVANEVIKMIVKRSPDVVLPRYLRWLIAVGHLWPRLGDWLLLKMTSQK